MTIRTTAGLLLAALLLLAQGPVGAAAADADEPEEQPDAPWSLSLASQVDQQSTRSFSGELGRDLTPDTALRVAVDSIDYSANNNGGFKSQGVEAGASHNFEHFSIAGALAHWQDTDIVTANEFKLGGDWHADPWSMGLRTGYRRSSFDPFQSKIDVTLKGGTVISAASTSRCKLDNTALGLDGRFAGDVWGGYATLMNYQYQDSNCQFTVAGRGLRSRADRRQLRDLSGRQLDRLSLAATRRIGREQALLDSSLDSGVSWKHDDLIVSLDYSRQKEFFIGVISNTYSVTGTADLGDHAGVDCTVGVTRGAGITQGGFVGFALRARF